MTSADIDWPAIAVWMDAVGIPGGPVEQVERISGGTQNILVGFDRGGVRYVLRRGPAHLRATSNDAMRREMRVLAALASTDVPHPRLVAACPDGGPLGGVAFYVMAEVDGFNPTRELPALHAGHPAARFAMGLTAVDAMAGLAAVDHRAVGLGDIGRPEGFLERQVPRWWAQLESYGRHHGWPGPEIPELHEVAAWLEANRPSSFAPGLSHGDFHLANLLYRRDGPGIAAIVDWEMCTVGDPLVDLGWLLATWPTTGPTNGAVNRTSFARSGGLAGREDLVGRYAAASARSLDNLVWYEVLACFRLGIILEGTYARSCAGEAAPATGRALHGHTLALFAHATTRMGSI